MEMPTELDLSCITYNVRTMIFTLNLILYPICEKVNKYIFYPFF